MTPSLNWVDDNLITEIEKKSKEGMGWTKRSKSI